jgi:hypothetical protein
MNKAHDNSLQTQTKSPSKLEFGVTKNLPSGPFSTSNIDNLKILLRKESNIRNTIAPKYERWPCFMVNSLLLLFHFLVRISLLRKLTSLPNLVIIKGESNANCRQFLTINSAFCSNAEIELHSMRPKVTLKNCYIKICKKADEHPTP